MRRIATVAVLVLVLAIAVAPCAFAASDADSTRDNSVRRTRVTVYPRTVRPDPTAIRHCDAWLVKEYRISGPVVVPQMRCVWR